MRIWIDLANAPHVLFFRPIRAELCARGHEVLVTARAFSQTLGLAERYRIPFDRVGGHGGRSLWRKALNIAGRAGELVAWGRGRRIDLAVGHNSYAQALAAWWLGVPLVTFMDYEHQPANHLNFRLARRVVVPRAFPDAALARCGARRSGVRRYDGLKEEVYLAGFLPDPAEARIRGTLWHGGTGAAAGIDLAHERRVVIVVRPPPTLALYHRFENPLFDHLLRRVGREGERCLVVAVPRTDEQRAALAAAAPEAWVFVPERAVDGPNLLHYADALVSAGGTMNREAAVLGTPAYTLFAGAFAAVDAALVAGGRLRRLATPADVEGLRLEKTSARIAATDGVVLQQALEFILEGTRA